MTSWCGIPSLGWGIYFVLIQRCHHHFLPRPAGDGAAGPPARQAELSCHARSPLLGHEIGVPRGSLHH
eukprot:1120588-Pyramimonas_sp.AAC.1